MGLGFGPKTRGLGGGPPQAPPLDLPLVITGPMGLGFGPENKGPLRSMSGWLCSIAVPVSK